MYAEPLVIPLQPMNLNLLKPMLLCCAPISGLTQHASLCMLNIL